MAVAPAAGGNESPAFDGRHGRFVQAPKSARLFDLDAHRQALGADRDAQNDAPLLAQAPRRRRIDGTRIAQIVGVEARADHGRGAAGASGDATAGDAACGATANEVAAAAASAAVRSAGGVGNGFFAGTGNARAGFCWRSFLGTLTGSGGATAADGSSALATFGGSTVLLSSTFASTGASSSTRTVSTGKVSGGVCPLTIPKARNRPLRCTPRTSRTSTAGRQKGGLRSSGSSKYPAVPCTWPDISLNSANSA
jgi:hypothetical protein